MASQPNILWICTDQQRFDTLGCYGNPFVHTPNLDRLAQQSVLFEHAFSQSPVCTPSRASFLTGRYPRTTRCRQNGQTIPADEVLVTKTLHDAGYVCGLAGKLHLSACHPSACPGTEKRTDDGYDQFFWSHDPVDRWPTNDYFQWLHDKGIKRDAKPFPDSKFVQVLPSEAHSQTTYCVERTMTFIERCSELDKPWAFSLNIFDPHHAFDPPCEDLERYRDKLQDIPLPNYIEGELDNKPIWQRIDHEGSYGGKGQFAYDKMTETDHRWLTAAYWAMVDVIDRQIGRLLDCLEKTGQRDNTYIIFTSDHGEMLGDHGIYLKGPFFYEPAIRIPLLISGPGLRNDGTRSKALVELIDLAPSILEWAHLEASPAMQGKSLNALLQNKAPLDQHRDDVYCEYYNSMPGHKDPQAHATMIRTERFKLVVAHGTNSGELYDLQNDPTETHNLWNNPKHAPKQLDMLTRLTDRMAWTVDPLPPREAGF
jgi:arylsulfatase